jgi:serine protease inhibitor
MGSGAVEPPPRRLTFDRPFLLLLEDTGTHTPLFLASIGDPSTT